MMDPLATMRIRIGIVAAILIACSVTALADKRSDAKAKVTWGVTIAQKGLWRDATMQWENATVIDPTYASAWNNLAIGYEQLGRFEDARKAYERALELEPNNQYIHGNYDMFREVYDRQNRARGR